jgi:hypothetical protein
VFNSNENIRKSRKATSIESAKKELYFKPNNIDPRKYININDGGFFGLIHEKDEKNCFPIYVPDEATNHVLLCGITRSGKGILAGIKSYETMQHKNKGLIYLDVKKEVFTPQIIKDELKIQGRSEDLEIVTFPNDFCYTGLNDEDTIIEIFEKFCIALEIEKSENDGVDFYRKNERQTILKLLKNCLGEYFKNDWYEFMIFIEALLEDLKKKRKANEEMEKSKVNFDKLEKLKDRYFDDELYNKLNFNRRNIEALETIYIKLYELTMGANIYSKYTLHNALYNGKILYILCDMENEQSLQFLKILQKDISQLIRKRKANCTVIADEISFYATNSLSAGLATHAGFGVNYILQLQDLGQISDENLRSAILTNCSVKCFYKISDDKTLKYVETLGGMEYVTNTALKGSLETVMNESLEPLLNATRIRAMWYKQNAILIAEYYNTAYFISTSFIPVKNEFDWISYKSFKPLIERKIFELKNKTQDIDIDNEENEVGRIEDF